MKKIALSAFVIFSLSVVACKNNKEQTSSGTSETASANSESATGNEQPANAPKTYKLVFTPDSAILGKQNEALVKVTGSNAVALQDPDGKDNGVELTIKLQLTNKEKIGEGSGIHVDYSDSRLQLDNGNNISADNGTDFLRAEPESTSKEETWTYKIPAGAKPAALNLFMDGTRVSIKIAYAD